MFKKAVKVSAQNQLSGKDRKTVKNKLATLFDEPTLETLFNKNDKIVCNKISGSKMLIYMTEQYPLFVDATGKEDFFPSVYTCSAYQPLSKSIVINQGVQTFIYNGANLMWPGVSSFAGLGNFKKDEVVSIRNLNGEVIAIGALGCSLEELKENQDGTGIAAYILHFKGDRLWDMGSKVYPEVVVKAKQVKIEQKKVQEKVEAKQVKKQESQSEQEQKPKAKGKQKKQQVKKQQKKDKTKKKQESQAEQQQKGKGKGKKQQPKKDDKKNNKKAKKQDSEQEQQEKPQPKGKNNKDKPAQTKPVKKQKQAEPESDDQDLDFGGFVHTNKKERPQIQMEKKKVPLKFSDDEDDKKGKKKPQKKAAKKPQSDEQQQPVQPVPAKKQKNHQAQSQQQDNKKNKGKKGKGKKQKEESEQQQKPQTKKQNKKKPVKKEKREQSEDQNEQHEEKAEKEEQQKQQKEGKSAISGQLMDQHFKEAFLNVLKLTKVEAELPVDSGRFFSDYMVLARPEGVKLQIKDTTYKKLGKFYEQMAKEKLIEFKPAKEKKGQQGSTITKIFWQNEQLKNYFPTIKRMREKEVQQKEQVYSKQKLKLSKTVQVDYVYKLSDELKQILYKKTVNYMPSVEEEEAMAKQQDVSKKDVFLNDKQLKQKIEKYINDIVVKQKQTKEQKQGKQKQKKVDKLITLSYKDNKFIYELLKSQIEQYEQNLQKQEMMAHNSDQEQKKEQKKAGKKDKHKKNLFRIERGYLFNKIMKLAHSHYNISDKETGLNKFKEGTFKGIQLIADKVVNKNVTKIIGLQNFIPSTVHEDQIVKQIHGFSHTLQVKFASSSNVQNLPGKNAGRQIVIQGNFVDELENLLMSEYGIKKDYITIQNKLGKKKKN